MNYITAQKDCQSISKGKSEKNLRKNLRSRRR